MVQGTGEGGQRHPRRRPATHPMALPVGMPLCRPMGAGLYEVRTTLANNRIARILIALYRGQLVALHAFIKKTATTPDADVQLARKRLKEIEHEKEE